MPRACHRVPTAGMLERSLYRMSSTRCARLGGGARSRAHCESFSTSGPSTPAGASTRAPALSPGGAHAPHRHRERGRWRSSDPDEHPRHGRRPQAVVGRAPRRLHQASRTYRGEIHAARAAPLARRAASVDVPESSHRRLRSTPDACGLRRAERAGAVTPTRRR